MRSWEGKGGVDGVVGSGGLELGIWRVRRGAAWCWLVVVGLRIES